MKLYGIPVIHLQQITFPQSKELVYLPVLIFDRRNESDLRGTIIGENYETQYLVPYDFKIESVDCHSIHALFLDGNPSSQSRPGRDGFAV